jgi:hypothetical protein
MGMGHIAGDLRQGKDVDQVEEQLEGRRPVVLAGGTNPAQEAAGSLHLVLFNHVCPPSQGLLWRRGGFY